MKFRRPSIAISVALALAACGGGQTRLDIFSHQRGDDGGSSLAALVSKLAHSPIPQGSNVAVGVVDDGLVGIPLQGGETWAYRHPLDSRPVIAKSAVIGMGGGELFALDARTGEPLWTRRAGGTLRGAGDDGQTTVVSLASKGENATTLLAILRDGRVVRQLEAQPTVGVPAVLGSYAFFPWQQGKVTVYDLTLGDEVARFALSRPASRAFTLGNALYFGEEALYRFDEELAHAPARAAFITALARELPGSPQWQKSGRSPLPVAADARDKVRLYARPTEAGPLAIEGEKFVGTYFKLAMGFDAESGVTSWVRTFPSELLGGAAYRGGAALCDAEGTVHFLDQKTGGAVGSISLGRRLKACVVEADDFTREPVDSALPLVEQLTAAIQAKAPELIAMQRELLRELGSFDEGAVTEALIAIASSPNTPTGLFPEARAALSARRTGAVYMLEALERHYDYLRDELLPPPVGPLAEALAAMKEKAAAPLLSEHLLDPAVSSLDIESVAAALVVLADTKQLPELQTFFALYRATADDEALVRAVGSVARAIVAILGDDGRALIAKSIDDPTTVPEVQRELANVLEDNGPGARLRQKEVARGVTD